VPVKAIGENGNESSRERLLGFWEENRNQKIAK
jgi:hypothetical protein